MAEPRGVHQNRKTIITFDDHIPNTVQPYTAIQKEAEQVAASTIAETTNTHYVPGIGWRLKEYFADDWQTYELTVGQDSIIGSSEWTKPAVIESYDSYHQKPYSGVTYDAGVQAAGSEVMQKRIGGGDSWAERNDADQASYPSPLTSEDPTTMDRVLTWNSNHEPSDAVAFSFYVPANKLTSHGPLFTAYFCGPAGSDDGGEASGQYGLKFYGRGEAKLFEKRGSNWVFRHRFNYCLGPSSVYGAIHNILIYTDCLDAPSDGYPGRTITFLPLNFPTGGLGNKLIGRAVISAADAIRLSAPRSAGLIYDVPRLTEAATVIAPLRVDVRRDVRAVMQIRKAKFPTSGEVYDDIISLPFYPDTSEPFYVEAWGEIPTGTTMTVEVYDADTGTILTGGTTYFASSRGIGRTYTPNDKQRRYRVKVKYTSTGDKTPVMKNIRVFRNGIWVDPGLTTVSYPLTPTNLQRVFPSEVHIKGLGKDAMGESADFVINDLTGEDTVLKTKSGVPVRIETEYNSSGDKATLFKGYVMEAVQSHRKGGNTYGSGYSKIDVNCAGEWARLQEAIVPQRYNWWDNELGLPDKITDIIDTLLSIAYPSGYRSIPDIDIRLLTFDESGYITEFGQKIGEVITKLAEEYLGAYVIFDTSVGDGKWRLLQQKAAPYNYLVRFETEHPGAGKLPHIEASYGTSTNGSQTVQHTFVRKKTARKWIERPEGNLVYVVGAATGADANSTGSGAGRISQVAVNVESYNFLNLDPLDDGYPDGSSIDYLGREVPIFVIDSTLTSQEAVDWVCRRIYDMACHARTYMEFEAPLVLVEDVEDLEQTKPRPLRFYDAVQVYDDGEWKDYLVLSCDPSYTKDHIQMARYKLVRPSNIDVKGVMPWRESTVNSLTEIVKRIEGRSAEGSNSANVVANKAGMYGRSGMSVLPEVTGAAIQDLDNTSLTFGEFVFNPDFDPIL